jgi:prolyl 4-hydroxylase
MTNELLEMNPKHERALGNKFYYEKELRLLSSKAKLRGDDGSDEVPKDKTVVMINQNIFSLKNTI